MKKKKAYEISVIDKTYSNTFSDETKFYTSDTALELSFELKETEYNFESAEIVLLNVDDRSLATRPVSKVNNDFIYDIDDDITAHYGDWRGQLRFEKSGEIYVSSPVKFRIENDLSNERPPQLSDVQSWVSLKRYADNLVDELKQAVLNIGGIEDTFNANEATRKENEETRQQAESERQSTFETNETERKSAELIRVENENGRIENDSKRETEITNIKNDVLYFSGVILDNLVDYSAVVSTDYDLTINGTEITAKVKNLSPTGVIGFVTKDRIAPPNTYYMRMEVEALNKSYTTLVFGGFSSTNVTSDLIAGQSVAISSISQPTSPSSINQVRFTHRTSTDGYAVGDEIKIKNVVAVNLTSAFGAGNEPTKEVMEWIISENGYFEELTLRRDDIQQYEINQLRKAVLALGGTI